MKWRSRLVESAPARVTLGSLAWLTLLGALLTSGAGIAQAHEGHRFLAAAHAPAWFPAAPDEAPLAPAPGHGLDCPLSQCTPVRLDDEAPALWLPARPNADFTAWGLTLSPVPPVEKTPD